MTIRISSCRGCGTNFEQSPQGGSRSWCESCVPRRVKQMRELRGLPKPAIRKCRSCGRGYPWARTPYCAEECRPPRRCRGCGAVFTGKNRVYCSDECKPPSKRLTYHEKRALQEPRVCADPSCGLQFNPCHKGQRWCSLKCAGSNKSGAGPRGGLSPEARERQRLYWQAKCRRRRAAKQGGLSEPYTLAEIARRDSFKCQLCGTAVPMDVKVPEALAPTIDHVVPVSRGGDDTRANVQLAHFRCNSVKGARDVRRMSLAAQEVGDGTC
ncbi:HNH endonuclease [Streptomyces sp. NPDC096030]|uniref:HNH endonuclease n=1 Tax=Streptomyces sp. NPDC096030 TaxID=3155423 RepID=UPI003322C1D9